MYILNWKGDFDAAHRLPDYDGKCANLHGHTWKVEVEIKTKALIEDRFVLDFTVLKQIVNTLDHKYLNDLIEVPTAENIAKYFWLAIGIIDGSGLWESISVKVYEDERSSITYVAN